MNLNFSRNFLQRLIDRGVHRFCVCAGSRNAPMVVALERLSKSGKIKIFRFFDERSAAFFAVGQMRVHDQPVAVITSSGTAVAELAPAVVEAHYQNLPLFLLTADRPKRFRQTGAPQSIEHMKLFSGYCAYHADVEIGTSVDLPTIRFDKGPIHFNFCFEEPLFHNIDQEVRVQFEVERRGELGGLPDVSRQQFLARLAVAKKPVAIVAALDEVEKEKAKKLIEQLALPYYAEILSGIKGLNLAGKEIRFESSLAEYGPDFIFRFGGVPVARFWRNLEDQLQLPVFSFSRKPFTGLSRASHLVQCGLEKLDVSAFPNKKIAMDSVTKSEDLLTKKIMKYQKSNPRSEHSLLMALGEILQKLGGKQQCFLANSLPVREWDWVGGLRKLENVRYFCNRGANGIDGQLSSFFGSCQKATRNVAILGDLSLLYDFSAGWIAQEQKDIGFTVVVVNNRGGRIFESVKDLKGPLKEESMHKLFTNHHTLNFEGFAKTWGWDYQRADKAEDLRVAERSDRLLLEICPVVESSSEFFEMIHGAPDQ